MTLKTDLSDTWQTLDSELNRVEKAIEDFGNGKINQLDDTIGDIKRDLTDARATADRLEKLIDSMDEE